MSKPFITTPDWYVVTGGPSSGKTTILKQLKKRGHQVVFEAARFLIDLEMKKGKTLSQIRSDEKLFQRRVLDIKKEWEQSFPKTETIFLERGMPDSLAYYRKCSAPIDTHLQTAVAKARYKKVFILELTAFKADYARTETAEEAKEIEELIIHSYRETNHDVVLVPPLSLKQRVDFILHNVKR